MMRTRRSHLRLLALGIAAVLAVTPISGVPRALGADPSPVAALPNFGLPSESDIAADANRPVNDDPGTLDVMDLGQVADAGYGAADALPADQWDIRDVEWSLQGDPYAAFAFVRDHIAYVPYAGVLRGPQGTLSARSGNAFDRALLLKTLLNSMLVPARFAFGTLDDATAARVLATTFQAPSAPLQDAGVASMAPLDPNVIVSRARRDYARLRLALGDRLNSLAPSGPDLALAETRQHVWVQMAAGPTWVDLDPTMPDAVAGGTLATSTGTADALPEADFQTVDVQLVAQTDSAGQLTESTVLDRRFTAADSASSEIFLYFQPDVSGLGGTILSTLTGIHNYEAQLLINGTVESGSPFVVNASGSDVLGNASGDTAELAGLKLVITAEAPAEARQSNTTVLLDRVPTALSGTTSVALDQLLPMGGDLGGPYALQPIEHILISNGGADPRDHAVQRGEVADFGAQLIDPTSAADYAMQDVLWPTAVADKVLALASERAIVAGLSDQPDVRAVIAQPRVYLTSIGPDPRTATGIALTTDLALDGVRIVSAAGQDSATEARYQLWYGALQTAMESEFGLDGARLIDPVSRSILGASYATSASALTVLDAASPPSTAPAAVFRALRAGQIVIVPGDVASAKVWWTVGPGGVTRSILDPDLGGDGAGGRYGGGRVAPPPKPHTPGNYRPPDRPVDPPSRCGAGQEYVTLVGCVSIPAAWAIRVTVFTAVAIACQLAWSRLLLPYLSGG